MTWDRHSTGWLFSSCLLAMALFGAAGGAQQAQTPPPFGDFTFKRVGVGDSLPGRRITVQIAPDGGAEAAVAAGVPAPGAGEAHGGAARYPAFWQQVSPALADAAPGRLAEGVRAVREIGVPAPALDALRGLSAAHGRSLLLHSIGTQVSPALALAVMSVESGGRAAAVSEAGAKGLMQLMPDTAREVGVTDRTDPDQSIRGGIAYLDGLMARFGRDPILVLAAYNAGPGAVDRAGGVPDIPETRDYVPKVLAAWTVARALCLTPPELVSDGCVFAPPGG